METINRETLEFDIHDAGHCVINHGNDQAGVVSCGREATHAVRYGHLVLQTCAPAARAALTRGQDVVSFDHWRWLDRGWA